MQSNKEQLNRFNPIFEQLPNALKVTGIAGSACGFIYIFAYTRTVGIPFPLELSVLPTLLLLVGITSIIAMTFLVGGILIPALITEAIPNSTKLYFLPAENTINHPSKNQNSRGKKWRISLRRYLICYWPPMATSLLATLFTAGLGDPEWNTQASMMLFGISGTWILITPYAIKYLYEERWQYILTTLLQTILSIWAYCLAIFLVVALYPESANWPAWQGFLLILAIFSLLHMFITLPHHSRSTPILLPPYYEHKIIPATSIVSVIAICITALSLFMEPVSAKIGGIALRLFGIGGGMPAQICLKNSPPKEVTQAITFGPDFCSERAALLFDSGDKIYITKLIKEPSLPDAISPKSPQALVFFRQDEIRAKIYLPLPKKIQ